MHLLYEKQAYLTRVIESLNKDIRDYAARMAYVPNRTSKAALKLAYSKAHCPKLLIKQSSNSNRGNKTRRAVNKGSTMSTKPELLVPIMAALDHDTRGPDQTLKRVKVPAMVLPRTQVQNLEVQVIITLRKILKSLGWNVRSRN